MNSVSRWLTLNAAFLMLTAPSFAHEGNEGSGGGDRYAAHFASVGDRLSGIYKLLCSVKSPDRLVICANEARFAEAVEKAQVLPREVLTGSDGQPREAGPDGRGNIEINSPLYRARIEQSGSAEGTASVVAHEYMILSGAESEDVYFHSATLIKAMKANYVDFSTLVPTAPARPTSSNDQLNHLICTKDALNAPVGTRCKSDTTHEIFERVATPHGFGPGWKTANGLVWQQQTSGETMRASHAVDYCQSIGARLPTSKEAKQAVNSGIFHYLQTGPERNLGDWTSTPVQVNGFKSACGMLGHRVCKDKPVATQWVMKKSGVNAPEWYDGAPIKYVDGELVREEPMTSEDFLAQHARCVR